MNSEVLNNPVPGNIEVNQAETKKKSNNKVDINLLMSRVREDEKKEKKESIFFFSLRLRSCSNRNYRFVIK